MTLHALEITRYVSIGGTGDGLTPENPTADLGGMLALSAKVDQLTLYVAPGFYSLNFIDNGEGIRFKNIILDGTWKKEEAGERVRINYPRVKFTNSIIQNVSFSGSVEIDGGIMYDSDADKVIYASFDNGTDVQLYNCTSKSFNSSYYGYGQAVSLTMAFCTAKNGSYGLQTNNINTIKCKYCKFFDQSEGGINIDNSHLCSFTNCEFGFNRGDGAVRITNFDNSAQTEFSHCQFIANTGTYNQAYNIYVYSNVTFADCLFADNTVKNIDRMGFIHLVRADFIFLNCSFINNKGGVEMESYYPDRYQIVNCLFWNNGKTVAYAGGNDVPMHACAMDHGTGIPELDREKGLIILTDANKGFEYNGTDIELKLESPLINAGAPRRMDATDLYGHPHNAFGATDIGCVEFFAAPGVWSVDPSQQTFEIAGKQYQLCKANAYSVKREGIFVTYTQGDIDYYCLLPSGTDLSSFSCPSYFTDLLYLDTMPVTPTIHDGKYVEIHTKNSKDTFNVYVYKASSYGFFDLKASAEYESASKRQKVKITDNKIEFIKPTPRATPTGKASPAKKTTGTTNKSYKK